MELESILALSLEELTSFLERAGVDCDDDADEEELQSLAYSVVCSYTNFDTIYELSKVFGESFELISMLLDSTEGHLTAEVVDQLQELHGDVQVLKVRASTAPVAHYSHGQANTLTMNQAAHQDGIDSYIVSRCIKRIGTNCAIIAVDSDVSEPTTSHLSSSPCCNPYSRAWKLTAVILEALAKGEDPGAAVADRICVRCIPGPLPFGLYRCLSSYATSSSGSEPGGMTEAVAANCPTAASECMLYDHGRVLVQSATYSYVLALDEALDRLQWGWEGSWTEELECALLELLVAVEEDLTEAARSWQWMDSISAGVDAAAGATGELSAMVQNVRQDVQVALAVRSTYAVGRLYQTLVQFVETRLLAAMLRLPKALTDAIGTFLRAMVRASPTKSLRRDLLRLATAASDYADSLDRFQQRHQQQATTADSPTAKIQAFLHEINKASWFRQVTIGTPADSSRCCADGFGAPLQATACATTPAPAAYTSTVEVGVSGAAAGESSSSEGKGGGDDDGEGWEVTYELITLIHSLKPQDLGQLATGGVEQWHPMHVDFVPKLYPLEYVTNPLLLRRVAWRLCETLLGDVVGIGSVFGFTIDLSDPGTLPVAAAVISNLLGAGFAYVTTRAGKLMALLPPQRSLLHLTEDNNFVFAVDDGAEGGTEGAAAAERGSRVRDEPALSKRGAPAEPPSSLQLAEANSTHDSDKCHTTAPPVASAAPPSGQPALKKRSLPSSPGGKPGKSGKPSKSGKAVKAGSGGSGGSGCSGCSGGCRFRLPPTLKKRLRDMPRVFRNKVAPLRAPGPGEGPPQLLSLRLNSDLTEALRLLRLHHGEDCWVGPPLEAVWRLMAATVPPRLLIFELWLGDRMIAADFAHPVGIVPPNTAAPDATLATPTVSVTVPVASAPGAVVTSGTGDSAAGADGSAAASGKGGGENISSSSRSNRSLPATAGVNEFHGCCRYGDAVYVATRFFDRGPDVRALQPGFLLALAECKVLRDRGCRIWDLGNVNLNPLMRYKLDLTGPPVERAVALHALHELHSSSLRSGFCGAAARPAITVTSSGSNSCNSCGGGGGGGGGVGVGGDDVAFRAASSTTRSSMYDLRSGVLVEDLTLDHLLAEA